MKLIIQIPCYNEEQTLPLVVNDIPKFIEGIDQLEIQIIDDGSTDNTIQVAKELGVDHIIENIGNKGLGNSFRIGMDHALKQRADILINTDGDNQYPSSYIPELIQPILRGEADIVLGNRQTNQIQHFSILKKILQRLGTKITILLSGENDLEDAVSGFRAYSRQAMLELNVTSQFSYVLDTTIQASNKRIKMVSIPIITNAPTRESRLFKNIWQHIRKSSINLLRVYSMYYPLRVFLYLALLSFVFGLVPFVRFIYYYLEDNAQGKIQSLILGSLMISISINLFALGILSDIIHKNKILVERILKKLKEISSVTNE